MEKHFFPLIFDYLIRGKEGRGEGRKDRMDFAREEIEERLSRGKKIVSYMWESAYDNAPFLSNFSGRKKTFYQFSIWGKEGEDEGRDREMYWGSKKNCA